MSEPSNSFFSQKALDKMRGVDDLNRSLRLASPRFWVVLCACGAFLAGFLIWAVFGKISATVTVNGANVGGQIHCFVTAGEADEVDPGDEANVNGVQMKVTAVSDVPLSAEEARQILQSDYLTDTIVKEKWMYHVTFDGDASALAGTSLVKVHIITRSFRPIHLILGGEE